MKTMRLHKIDRDREFLELTGESGYVVPQGTLVHSSDGTIGLGDGETPYQELNFYEPSSGAF